MAKTDTAAPRLAPPRAEGLGDAPREQGETERIPPEVYAAFRRWYIRYLWVQYYKRQRLTNVL